MKKMKNHGVKCQNRKKERKKERGPKQMEKKEYILLRAPKRRAEQKEKPT